MKPARIGFRVVLALVVLALVAVALFTAQPVRARRAGPLLEGDAAALERHVRMLAQTLVPRDLDHPGNLDRAAEYIAGEMRAAGLRVTAQPYRVGRETARNVRAEVGAAGGARVVVGAHYDAFGGHPGADDNASGVAVLLELARLLAAAPPERLVEVVAYSCEEPPWFRSPAMGSAVHVRELLAHGERVEAMLSLEMLGAFSTARGSQSYPMPPLALLYGTRGDFVALAGRPRDVPLVRRAKAAMASVPRLKVRSFNAPPRLFGLELGLDLSDHASYWDAGVPAILVTDTAFFRNPRYHTVDDTPETLDYRGMALVVSGVHQAVLALAGSASR